jgi:hypothetical protein
MRGAPLAIAVLERKLVSSVMTTVISGDPLAACVTIDPAATTPTFTCNLAGRYLLIWQGKTYRNNTTVAVSSPSGDIGTQNENEWKKISFEQLMSVTIASPGASATVSSTKQTREWFPFDNVSHPWLANLATSDVSTLTVTNAESAANREWFLVIWRLGNFVAEVRDNPNILIGNGSTPSITGSITRTTLTTSNDWKQRFRIVCTAGTNNKLLWEVFGGGATYSWRPAFNHLVTVNVRRNNAAGSWPGGSITLKVGKPATLYTTTITIPTDESIATASYLIVGGTIGTGGTEYVQIEISDIDSGEEFEIEASVEVQL